MRLCHAVVGRLVYFAIASYGSSRITVTEQHLSCMTLVISSQSSPRHISAPQRYEANSSDLISFDAVHQITVTSPSSKAMHVA